MIRLALILLIFLNILSCKTKKVTHETAYEKALRNGVQLLEKDTVQVALNQVVLFPFEFSDGVHILEYMWQIYQQDSTVIRYIETEEFHFAPPDVDGGPAAGIYRYQVLKEGVHKLLFFIPSLKEIPLTEAELLSSGFEIKECYIHVTRK